MQIKPLKTPTYKDDLTLYIKVCNKQNKNKNIASDSGVNTELSNIFGIYRA